MKITMTGSRANLFTPYNKEFVSRVKTIGGARWDANERCWSIPKEEVETARAIMMDVYGESDLPAESGKITVEVTINEDIRETCEGISLFGKTLARAYGRDSGARVGDEVTLVSGRVRSGGSVKNWCTVIEEGSILRIRNLTKKALEIPTEYDITVKEIKTDEIDREALLAERERLLARIAEIDNMLNA